MAAEDDIRTEGCALHNFLRLLFGHMPPGFIEIRLIEDWKSGDVIERCWYENPSDLSADLPRLLEIASARNTAIFFGVLPRKARGKGKAQDTLAGSVVWTDLDFKDFADGEAEARKRIESFPLSPSIVVRTGHGLHVYWVIREPTDPHALSSLSRRMAQALGADHVFDAARLLRLPDTYNRKDQANLILVQIEALHPDRLFNASEITEALDLVGEEVPPEAGTKPPNEESEGITTGDKLSERVLALLDGNRRLRDLFDGKGKTEVGEDGRTRDTSSSGFDFSVVMALAMKGVRDPSELATAINCRPDGAARAKGRDYIVRTVINALNRVAAADRGAEAVPCFEAEFKVEELKVFASNPAYYRIKIDGKSFVLGSGDLHSKPKFAVKFMDAIGRIPLLPDKRPEWIALVNSWLADSQTIEMPPEASEEPALRSDVEVVIANIPQGEEVEDLDHGKALQAEGGVVVFKVETVLAHLKADRPEITRGDVSRILRELGYQSRSMRFGEAVVRGWAKQ